MGAGGGGSPAGRALKAGPVTQAWEGGSARHRKRSGVCAPGGSPNHGLGNQTTLSANGRRGLPWGPCAAQPQPESRATGPVEVAAVAGGVTGASGQQVDAQAQAGSPAPAGTEAPAAPRPPRGPQPAVPIEGRPPPRRTCGEGGGTAASPPCSVPSPACAGECWGRHFSQGRGRGHRFALASHPFPWAARPCGKETQKETRAPSGAAGI